MVLKLRSQTDSVPDGDERRCDEPGGRGLSLMGALVAGLKSVLMGGDYASSTEDAQANSKCSATPRTILIIRSQEAEHQDVVRLLKTKGHDVLTAASSFEALSILQYQHVETLILDYHLDNTDGASLLHAIREERLSEAPAFFVSSDQSPIALRAMREAGAVSVLAKPADGSAIDQALASYDAGELQPDPKSLRARPLACTTPESWKNVALFDCPVVQRFLRLSAVEPGFGELLELSPNEWAQLTDTVVNLLVCGNVVRVRQCAHTLKGSASQLGALRLTELMRRLIEEKAAHVLSHRDEWASEVRAVAEQTIAHLKTILAAPPGEECPSVA